jgi:putative flippase GtrA
MYYVALCVLSITLNALLMAVVSSRGVSGFVAQIICSCVLMIVNFAISNGWVFRYETKKFK